jgi:cytoskeletal protein CcmA (bactofilin family)
MNTSPQPGRPGTGRPTEIVGRRPLPLGIVGLSALERAQPSERRESTPGGTLIVGDGIQVKGKIESCQRLIVEGHVEAAMTAETLEVLAKGLFEGTAEVDSADIAGAFDGVLIVRGQLTVKESGRVSGTIRYGRIRIEAGGEISGEIESARLAQSRHPNKRADAAAS